MKAFILKHFNLVLNITVIFSLIGAVVGGFAADKIWDMFPWFTILSIFGFLYFIILTYGVIFNSIKQTEIQENMAGNIIRIRRLIENQTEANVKADKNSLENQPRTTNSNLHQWYHLQADRSDGNFSLSRTLFASKYSQIKSL